MVGSQYQDGDAKPYLLAGIVSVSWIFKSIMFNNTKNNLQIFSVVLMYSLICLIYDRVSKLSTYSFKQNNLGRIVSLVSSDFDVILIKFPTLMEGLFVPLEIIACSVLIILQFGWTGVVVIAVILLIIPLSVCIVKISVKMRKGINVHKDARVSQAAELIAGIKYIKLYSWGQIFKDKIQGIR